MRKKKKEQENEIFEFITLPPADNSKIERAQKGIPQYSESELYEDLEEKMENLKPKGKKGRRKKIFQVLFLVVVCVLSVVLLMGLGDLSGAETVTIGVLFRNARIRYFLISIGLTLLALFCEAFLFSFLCRITTGRFRPFISFKTAVLGKYYDDITPLGAGGQPFQMVYLAKNDVPIGVATSLPLVKYFTWILVNIPICAVLLLVNAGALSGIDPAMATTVRVASWIGIALNACVPLFIVTFTFLPKLGEKLVGGVLKLGVKMKLVRNYDKMYEKATKTVVDFRSSMRYVSKNPLYILVCALLMLCILALNYSIPYFVVLSFSEIEPSTGLWYNIVTLNVFSMFASSFIPTPGGAGAIEGTFYIIFAGLPGINGGHLFWIVLIWRFLTFYFNIILGLCVVAYDFVKNSIRDKIINRKHLSKLREKLLPKLVSPDAEERLASVTMLRSTDKEDRFFAPKARERDQKLILKTFYSSASFTPSEIAYACYAAGNKIAGIADLDTLSGAREFSDACEALGMGALVGVEVSCYLSRSQKQSLRLNNLYQDGVLNLVLTGIPRNRIDRVNQWLSRYRERRSNRNRRMVDALNERVEKIGIHVEYSSVLAASKAEEGGTVTEWQILVAFANALVDRYSRGAQLIDALVKKLGIPLPEKTKKNLSDVVGNKNYTSDLASALRSEIMLFYVDADEDLCSILELMRIANEVGGLVVYPYMGDIEQMVFGELRVQKYEDAFLFELLSELAKIGVKGVTYCKSRHTPEQIARIHEFADKLGLMELSGETIFNNRQDYELEELDPETDGRAIRNAYAILGSQISAERDKNAALLSLETADKFPEWEKRVAYFASLAGK